MERNFNSFTVIMIIILVFAISFLFLENNFFIQGNVVEGDVYSNVTISKSISIEFSPALSNGILFGNVSILPVSNINGSENYNVTNNLTNYYILVSSDGNTAVDFCLRANTALTNQYLDVLELGNESYSCSNESNMTLPSISNETAFTLSSVKCGQNINPASNNYYRFWLDIPAAQPSGDYNNTLSFRGISSGESC